MNTRVAIGTSSFCTKDDTAMKILENAGIEVITNPYGRRLTEEEIMVHLQEVDGLIAGLEPLSKKVLSSASKLKAIARVGIGMDNVDLEAAGGLGIKVSNTPDGPTEAVAEMTIAALLALNRKIITANIDLHSGNWKKSMGIGLKDLKVLIIGYGRIGSRVSSLLRILGAQVMISDPYLNKSQLTDGEILVSLEEGLQKCQVISLHASGTDVILGCEEFSKIQDGIILLNSARGNLVEEQALIKALDNGKIKAAWFDVFWKEPYNGPLAKYEQVLLTPHISTYTRQCRKAMEVAAVNNLLRDLGL
ncbi:NAD(P)-dependent oxidoreductase [Anaeromicrobium sediminis]|uniref:Hydroxyacid dehydrogenase n=1 Tax=Anaeromicrobium sediminis TaxID=1478221 RepID=A0A267MK32_9FIRM|nr:NAD(P)-dependent oxidoreductase [Anaeromicrobium sediminis]PAB59153.1 hypothetical protein CCE28_11585 [Anaeromicrobium sediminis]